MTKEQRSIRRVPIPNARRTHAGDLEEDILYEREEVSFEEGDASSSWRRIILWGATIIFMGLLVLALSTSFTGANITVTPKTELVSINHEFTASNSEGAKLRFETLSISEEAETSIPADTTKKVSERATGTIVIYNAFSEKPQRLIKNTRFETKDGLIYRIGSSITVPGKTIREGRSIPGSVEATVAADAAGEEYNIPLSDFTIPGFKSDAARFAGFYARSRTPMAGGFEGAIKTPSEEALRQARTELKSTLQTKVEKDKQSAVPPGYILWDKAALIRNESLVPEESGESMSVVRERATGVAYLFKREDILQAIAKAALPSSGGVPIEIPELESLTFELKDGGNESAEVSTIRFGLTGTARVVFLYDKESLQQALVGKSKDELAVTLAAFPTIEKVDLVFRPFWSQSFPDNPKKIHVERASLGEAEKR